MKGFKVTYEIWSYEDIDAGDTDKRGWIDEDGIDCAADEYDIEDGLNDVDVAVRYLESEGVSSASSWPVLHEHDWFTADKWDEDFHTGEVESRSYHPVGYSVEELNEIGRKLKLIK